MPRFIRFDLFPATVTVRDSEGTVTLSHGKTRTFVTDDSVIVYVDGTTGVPENIYESRLDDFEGAASKGWVATTSEGDTVEIIRSGSCGCGSRLRGFAPFPGVPYDRMA